MKTTVLAMTLILASCGGQGQAATTPPATTTTVASTTTSTQIAVEIQDCTTPPVTFSGLCEVYELLQEWHVDRPIDDGTLAEIALESLSAPGGEQVPSPARVVCAIPVAAFTEFCNRLAELIRDTGEPVGPLVDAAVVAMVEQTLGPFTYYLPPDQVPNLRTEGVVGGIGVVLDATDAVGSRCVRITTSCPLEIVLVLEGNPGAQAGLMPGDQITAVDGISVEGQGFAATAGAIAGDETGVVEMTVTRDGETLTLTITRAEVEGPAVEIDLPREDVAYLRIPDFESDIPGLVHEGLEILSDYDPAVYVIDLRDNPGGLVDAAVAVASEFIPDGPVLEAWDDEESEIYEASGQGLAEGARAVVLVNRGTASAAEVLAGALRDRIGAVLVGSATFGKDALQIPFELRNGGRLNLTVARWLTPDGETVAQVGLQPDVELDLGTTMTTEDIIEAVLEATS